MSVRRIEIEFIGGRAIVKVDQDMVNARVRVTYKRDGSLSTLRIGQVSEVQGHVCGECDLPFNGSHDPGCHRRDRVFHALSRFVFPGQLVPRGEMADAVLAALDHGDDYAEYLPARHIVRSEEMEAFEALLTLVVKDARIAPGGSIQRTGALLSIRLDSAHRIWALWGEWCAGGQSVTEAREALKDVIRTALTQQTGDADA